MEVAVDVALGLRACVVDVDTWQVNRSCAVGAANTAYLVAVDKPYSLDKATLPCMNVIW